MKPLTTKKIFTLILLMSGMFSFTFVNAQPCPDGKIRVYKCRAHVFGCHSKCGFPNDQWSTFCPCEGRIANEPTGGEIFMLDVSPNPVSGSSVIYFFLEQPEKVSLKIYDLNGRVVTTLTDASYEEGDHEITWNAEAVNAGVYFLHVETESYSENRKLIVTK